MNATNPACSVCSTRTAPSYYKVSHLAPDGSEAAITTTCSIRCLISWAYQYATIQGTKLVWTAKEAIRQLFAKTPR